MPRPQGSLAGGRRTAPARTLRDQAMGRATLQTMRPATRWTMTGVTARTMKWAGWRTKRQPRMRARPLAVGQTKTEPRCPTGARRRFRRPALLRERAAPASRPLRLQGRRRTPIRRHGSRSRVPWIASPPGSAGSGHPLPPPCLRRPVDRSRRPLQHPYRASCGRAPGHRPDQDTWQEQPSAARRELQAWLRRARSRSRPCSPPPRAKVGARSPRQGVRYRRDRGSHKADDRFAWIMPLPGEMPKSPPQPMGHTGRAMCRAGRSLLACGSRCEDLECTRAA